MVQAEERVWHGWPLELVGVFALHVSLADLKEKEFHLTLESEIVLLCGPGADAINKF